MVTKKKSEASVQATFIRASAGTGKTFQLSNRYLQLLLQGVSPDSILASTFTRKAAGEILDRIVQRLARATRSESEALQLATQLDRSGTSREQFELTLFELLRHLDRCRISTLDSFFGQLARSHCLELGLPTTWSIVDDVDDAELRAEAVRRTLSEGFAHEMVHLLAKGETHRSIGQLVGNTISSLYTFHIDSTPDAWEHLPELNPLDVKQLEAVVARMREIKCEAKSIDKARESDLAMIEAGELRQLLDKGLGKKVAEGERIYNRVEIPTDLIECYRELIRHLIALRLLEQKHHLQGARRLLETFHQHYETLKREARVMRFDDVTRALDTGWETAAARGGIDQGDAPLEHLLLDEFQDTSPIQWRVLKPQVQTALNNGLGSLMVVGDTKQAIYGWRGGDARLFDAVEQFAGSNRKTLTLDISRRSAQAVLDVVNQIFELARKSKDWDRNHAAVQRWTGDFVVHHSAYPERIGFVQLEGAVEPFERAVQLAGELHRLAPQASIAILVRGNDSVGELISDLTRAGVPASEEAGKSIADAPVVRIMLSALTLIDHPDHSAARFHVAATPLGAAWGIKSEPDHGAENQAAISRIAAARRQELVHDGYGKTIERWIEPLLLGCEPRERQRLGQLVDLAFRYDPRATLRPSDFVRFVEREKVSDPSSAQVRVMNYHQSKGLEFDAVILPDLDRNWIGQTPAFVAHRPGVTDPITGIAPYVRRGDAPFVPEPLPSWTDAWRDEQLAESFSMFYVALTRAARALYLIAPETKNPPTLSGWLGLIGTALIPGETVRAGQVLYEAGAPDWYTQLPAGHVENESRLRVLPKPEPIVLREGDPRLAKDLLSVSPSSREGGFRIRVADLMRQGAPEALVRGTAVHSLFESVIWRSSIPTREHLRHRLEALEETPADADELIERFLQWCNAPQTGALLDQQQQLEASGIQWSELKSLQQSQQLDVAVANEYRFAFFDRAEERPRLCSGSIDRLVLFHDRQRTSKGARKALAAIIVDYKTDPISTEDSERLRERVSHYAPQLKAYRDAMSELLQLPIERISTQLAFVVPDRVITLKP